MAYTSCLSSYEMTEDLRSLEIPNYQKNLKTSKNDSVVPSLPAKIKIWLMLAKNF